MIGLAVSVLFLIPLANLIAPVIGTAAGIHLFNGSFWKKSQFTRAGFRPQAAP
jgi:uncharacterized protein involved in cysteine biosynthesis